MNDIQKNERVRLWISYPWLDRQEKDFACLLSELNAEHIEVVYDSVELLPDVHLRERIIQRLLSIGFDGLLYVLTYQCVTRRRCANELTEAIDQALLNMGLGYPIMGLLYGVADYQLPPRLRMQPCISLSTPDWTHQISRVLRSRSLQERRRVIPVEGRFDWKIHRCYCDDPSKTAIEVSSKEGMIQYWRFAAAKCRMSDSQRLQGPADMRTRRSPGLAPPTRYQIRRAPTLFFRDSCRSLSASDRLQARLGLPAGWRFSIPLYQTTQTSLTTSLPKNL
jgi:hypothetical protein